MNSVGISSCSPPPLFSNESIWLLGLALVLSHSKSRGNRKMRKNMSTSASVVAARERLLFALCHFRYLFHENIHQYGYSHIFGFVCQASQSKEGYSTQLCPGMKGMEQVAAGSTRLIQQGNVLISEMESLPKRNLLPW